MYIHIYIYTYTDMHTHSLLSGKDGSLSGLSREPLGSQLSYKTYYYIYVHIYIYVYRYI
jgi:hypothetical protein